MKDKKSKMTKEEKLNKARELVKDLKELELTDDELKKVSGGRMYNQILSNAAI